MADGAALRAHDIVFGHWKAEFSSWFVKQARHASVPVDAAVTDELTAALREAQQYVLRKSIEIDLQMFAPSRVLYRDLAGEELAELFGLLDDSDKVQAFRADATPVTRTHAQAYNYYCSKILNPPAIHDECWRGLVQKVWRPRSLGLDAFVKRQPQAKVLLDRVAKNFRDNVAECLDRVRNDKKAIEVCFLEGGTIKKITRITSPGSDPHKGGKSVAILTFEYATPQGGLAQRRVVYKPSDVEIDYRLAGRNTPALRSFLEAREQTRDKAGYPAPPYESAYEFIDRVALRPLNEAVAEVAASNQGARNTPPFAAEKARVLDMLALPSYVILPRNPGSRLTPNDSPPIRNSYGYLEYLTHEPSPLPPFGTPLDRYALDQVQANGGVDPQWDWITDRGDEARACFRLWGRLMTIACLFLQTDLHFENQRMRRRKPHLIDLENCLVKEARDPRDTLITARYGSEEHGVMGWWKPVVRANGKPADAPLDLEVQGGGSDYNVNVLFFYADGARAAEAWRVTAQEVPGQPRQLDGISLEVLNGMAECLKALRGKRAQLEEWIETVGLGKCIVRHVVRRTEDFTAAVSRFVDTMLGEQLKPASERQTQSALLGQFLDKERANATTEWGQMSKPVTNRCYLLETAEGNGRDYQNLDVPAWYRRVDSKSILSSEGRPLADDDNNPYYNVTGLDLLHDSLDTKLVQGSKQTQAVLNRFKSFLQTDLELMNRRR